MLYLNTIWSRRLNPLRSCTCFGAFLWGATTDSSYMYSAIVLRDPAQDGFLSAPLPVYSVSSIAAVGPPKRCDLSASAGAKLRTILAEVRPHNSGNSHAR
jgi:hypothetical protein